MPKIVFLGAGSTVFAKNVLGDALLLPSLQDAEIHLYDIDGERLADSRRLMEAINENSNPGPARIAAHLGAENRRQALEGADYVVNAIQVGGYEPCTVTDFEVPKRYGLRQTIGDTLGIGGIFRALRTLPVVLEIAREMERLCPDAWFLNYTNPMGMVTAGLLQGSGIRTVGLCHSVQECVPGLLGRIGMADIYPTAETQWKIAGINHQAWLTQLHSGERDLYPEIRHVVQESLARIEARGDPAWLRELSESLGGSDADPCYVLPLRAWNARREGRLSKEDAVDIGVATDRVRCELMLRLGFYLTESSEHTAEYTPWFIKSHKPELIDRYFIPLDEYPKRCRAQIAGWEGLRRFLVEDPKLEHRASAEFGAYIMHAMESDTPYTFAGNVMNDGLIANLPRNACVEVPCVVDRHGVRPNPVGELPEVCAAVNRTQLNPQILALDGFFHQRKDAIYQAAMLDPHTGAELSLDEIVALCDDLFEAHADWIPPFH